MIDIVEAYIARLRQNSGENAAWTLLSGRFYAGQAPEKCPRPYAVAIDMGGPVHFVFGGANLEEAHHQIDIVCDYTGDRRPAQRLAQALYDELHHARLHLREARHLVTRRHTRPLERIEERLIIVSSDWTTEYQLAAP